MGYKYYKLRYLLSLATVLSVPLGVIKSSPATEANNFFLNKSSWSKSSVHKFSRKFDIAPDITPDISLDIPVNNSIPSPLSPQYLFSQSPNQSESEDPNTRKVIPVTPISPNPDNPTPPTNLNTPVPTVNDSNNDSNLDNPNTPPPDEMMPTPAETPEETPTPATKVQVQDIVVKGSSILSEEEIKAITNPFQGKEVTLEELRQVADQITAIYLERGYITSRAVLPVQTIADGVVNIQVIEGVLGEINIEGNKRVKSSYIEKRIRLGAGKPLDTAKLENQLRLLRVDPLFENIEASLRAGDQEGESILIVRVAEADPWDLTISVDNYSPPSVGSERIGANIVNRNLTGMGDMLALSYYNTGIFGGDSDVFDFVYNLPVNAMNGSLQLRVAPNRNGIITEQLAEFDITGNTQAYEITFRQPLVRDPIKEFALSLGLTYQKSETEIGTDEFSPGSDDNDLSTSSTVIRFAQDYVHRDPNGAWALRSQFNLGLPIFGATETDSDGLADGQFISWLGQAQRLQRISDRSFLILQADLQLAMDPLLPYYQFIIGGGQSVRGYEQNIRSGDNGFRFSAENRITIYQDETSLPVVQLAPFFDMGMVWNHSNNELNDSYPDQRFLAGLGLGVIWQPIPQLSIRLDYARYLVTLEERGNNAQADGFYFNVILRPF
jgi:hemolysin activation/secretion protein